MTGETPSRRLARLTLEDHERQHGPLSRFSGCRCERCGLSRRILGPEDPSPTPWNFSTWGFYCDACERFFDLVRDGRVETHEGNACVHYHSCGAEARYIGYDHSKIKS
jgi:hypothetical protein